jgi:hemoglobin-like flavoprotein
VRGNMLQTTLECLLDQAGARAYAPHFVGSERVNHEGLGVSPEMFDRFYAIVIATFRESLGTEWTAETDAAWTRAADALMGAARG